MTRLTKIKLQRFWNKLIHLLAHAYPAIFLIVTVIVMNFGIRENIYHMLTYTYTNSMINPMDISGDIIKISRSNNMLMFICAISALAMVYYNIYIESHRYIHHEKRIKNENDRQRRIRLSSNRNTWFDRFIIWCHETIKRNKRKGI